MTIRTILIAFKKVLLKEIHINKFSIFSSFIIIMLTSSLYSCGIYRSADRKRVENGYFKVGNPYIINGRTYYPKVDNEYDEIGTASWYGPTFHGNKTANGATFNTGSMTAAHRTLPLPSVVRVTNLENNRSVLVVVNDRGPFSKDRIIDVSKKAAEALNFRTKGTARVRVQFLRDRTEKLLAELGYDSKKLLAKNDKNINSLNSSTKTVPVNIAQNDLNHQTVTTNNLASTTKLEDSQIKLVNSNNINQPTSKEIYIKAGTFGIKTNAQKVENDLKKLGNTKISNINVKGRNLYQVWLGPWLDKDSANNILQKVNDLGHEGTLIVSSQ